MPLITVDQFVTKHNGEKMDYDGQYGSQCVDVFRFYLKEVLGVNPSVFPGVKGAKNLWNFSPAGFIKIKNTPWNVPRKGDIMIFDGSLGHVDIFLQGNVLIFTAFAQNFPSQGYFDKWGNFIGTGVAHIQRHTYLAPQVIGWFRKI